MSKVLRLAFTLLSCMLLGTSTAWSQGTAFSCDGTFYQIRQVGTSSSLFRVNRSSATYTTSAINIRTVGGVATNDLGVLLNGLSYNPQDGFMYALSTTGTSGTLPTSIKMYKIGQGGIVEMGTVTGMPNIQVASGTIDKDGNYYVSSQNSTGTSDFNIYRFNISATNTADRLAATALRLYNASNTATLNQTFYDLALNPQDNLLYAVYQNGTLWRIDATSTVDRALVTPIKATATNTDPVGTSFFDVAGNMFVYTNGNTGTPNSGGFYQVNLTNGAYTSISSIDPASVSDGASCINPDQRIDIVKEVTNINRVTGSNGLAFDIAFRLRVKNTSTVTDNNVQVNDYLWSGTANTVRANTTFSSVSGKSASNVTIQVAPVVTADPTNSNPVFPLARNTSFSGIGGTPGSTGAALLTGNQSLTAGQAAIITFTVRVTYSAITNVPAGVTNQAYATSTTGANVTGYSQNASTGFLSSPDQLLATDASTDGPALPTVANSDSPFPTPVYFSTSIAGTVFEDINYGGGAGRSQTTSAGIGVEGARVELYSVNPNGSNTFLTYTTTDAGGNYVFSTTDGSTALSTGTQYKVRVVNSTVNSNRPGSTAGLWPVTTYIFGATGGATNQVGGADPTKFDSPANPGAVNGTGGLTITALQTANAGSIAETTTIVSTPSATATSPVTLGVDFGFNFSTVVNTNNSGQGSLRQFILNSNTLTNENLTQKSSLTGVTLTPGVEYAIFMMNDGRTTGTAPAGLRLGMTAPAGYSATAGFTITLTSALDAATIADEYTAIDGSLQEALTGNRVAAAAGTTTGPEVTINFNNYAGLFVTGAGTRIASLGLNGARGTSTASSGANFADGAAVTVSSETAAGTVITGVTTSNNATASVLLQNGATDVTISNSVLTGGRATTATAGVVATDAEGVVLQNASDNTISNNFITSNAGYGIELSGVSTNDNNLISGNTIRNNGTGGTANDSGISIQLGNNNLIRGNTINNNATAGIAAANGTSGNRFMQNLIYLNGGTTGLGIDLAAGNNPNGDGTTINDNGDGDTGANGILNFPVITQATLTSTTQSTGRLLVTGYAPPGATVELFTSDVTAAAFGEGQVYIATRVENSSDDADSWYGGYNGLVNGLNQGAETSTARFVFSIPLSTLTVAQFNALIAAGSRLTATATTLSAAQVNGQFVGNTSEYSGNAPINKNAPLPVELTVFEAKAKGADALLTWETASEKNNARFDVERSIDGIRFVKVGAVEGRGTTSMKQQYSLTDAGAASVASTVYYRLQQVDFDGTATSSPVRIVKFETAQTMALVVLPNPATELLNVRLSAAVQQGQVAVYSTTGALLHTQTINNALSTTVDVSRLPLGTYIIQVKAANGVNLNSRFVKQ